MLSVELPNRKVLRAKKSRSACARFLIEARDNGWRASRACASFARFIFAAAVAAALDHCDQPSKYAVAIAPARSAVRVHGLRNGVAIAE